MSAPTPVVRSAVYTRDRNHCVACDRPYALSFQHRRAVGMGGSKSRPGATDGLTLCVPCNDACEADMQDLALASGWKVRKWADPTRVPVYYPHEFAWFRLEGINRHRITGAVAIEMMHAVYGDQYEQWRAAQ